MFLYNKNIFRTIVFYSVCLASICGASFSAVAATKLSFPNKGKCKGCTDCTQNQPPKPSGRGRVKAGTKRYFEHFILQDSTNANADIYFPVDGRQPTTAEAAIWSCANVDVDDATSSITKWYINAFFTERFGFASTKKRNSVPIINSVHIIKTINFAKNVQRKFQNSFNVIAANPVGRVLLYRLLIEIRRETKRYCTGSCGDGIVALRNTAQTRNQSRSIKIHYNKNIPFQFVFDENGVKMDFEVGPIKFPCVKIVQKKISAVELPNPNDIFLFHEMLHWFQYLRHPARFHKEDMKACSPSDYMYLSRCYYGDISESFAWGGSDHQEMRTILGTPNYNTQTELRLFHSKALLKSRPKGGISVGRQWLPSTCKFYEGDDLSENAYRMSRHTAMNPIRMRFGHGGNINSVTFVKKHGNSVPPDRFQLAHLVAKNCCETIVGQNIINWDLISGEAAE